MRKRDWTDRPLGPDEALDVAGARVARVAIGTARLVSGDLDAALLTLAPGARMAGLAEDIGDGEACLRIARDRALLIAWTTRNWPAGWLPEGVALSLADDIHVALEIGGPGAADILAQISGFVPRHASPSCAVRIAGGHTALLVRRGDALLMLVERPVLTEVTGLLRGCVSVSDSN